MLAFLKSNISQEEYDQQLQKLVEDATMMANEAADRKRRTQETLDQDSDLESESGSEESAEADSSPE